VLLFASCGNTSVSIYENIEIPDGVVGTDNGLPDTGGGMGDQSSSDDLFSEDAAGNDPLANPDNDGHLDPDDTAIGNDNDHTDGSDGEPATNDEGEFDDGDKPDDGEALDDSSGSDTGETPDIDSPPQICTPYETVECPYAGPAGTKGIGICKAAEKMCSADGTYWGPCVGEVLPQTEICNNNLDDNCNEQIDEDSDKDGDGWGVCSGDCCDTTAQCADPKKVNPGAIEVQGDGIDNNCNSQIDEDPREICSTAQKFSGTGALDLLYAMDICKHSTGGSWGIVGTPTLTRANGSGSIDSSNRQVGVMAQFGSHASNKAIYGPTMAALSSGRARDNYDDPDKTTQISYSYYDGNPPADFIAPHGNKLPTTKTGCPNGSGANDGVMLSVQLKVPTNAQSFSFNFRFFSQEYKDWTCSKYNDFFITMLYTGASGIPADKNISFDSNGSYISVNSDQFFTVCKPKTGYTCPDGTAPLAGTGWNESNAGATKWLSTTAPVIPGETITLKFVIWDTSDRLLDSLVLLDNFKWSAEGTSGPSTFECWDLNKNGVCDVATEDQSGDGICNERDC